MRNHWWLPESGTTIAMSNKLMSREVIQNKTNGCMSFGEVCHLEIVSALHAPTSNRRASLCQNANFFVPQEVGHRLANIFQIACIAKNYSNACSEKV